MVFSRVNLFRMFMRQVLALAHEKILVTRCREADKVHWNAEPFRDAAYRHPVRHLGHDMDMLRLYSRIGISRLHRVLVVDDVSPFLHHLMVFKGSDHFILGNDRQSRHGMDEFSHDFKRAHPLFSDGIRSGFIGLPGSLPRSVRDGLRFQIGFVRCL